MKEQLRERVSEILGSSLYNETILESVEKLCNMVDELQRENAILQMRNTAILKRVARAKLELEQVV